MELTMKHIRSFVILLVVCLLMGLASPGAYAVSDVPAVTSTTIYMADPDSGAVYLDIGGTARVYPASLTKVMTTLLVVEAIEQGEASLSEQVTVQAGFDYDMIEGGSTAGILEGEVLTLEELLYCTMLVSANEAANIMAMYLYGDIQSFVDRMNERAAELGCIDTHFANPHGLPHAEHYSTAYDMFLITREAMEHDLFTTLCGTDLYTVPATNLSEARTLVNTNGLITDQGKYGSAYYYEYARGVKTGHTNEAGYCLISSAVKNQISPICVVMGGTATKVSQKVTEYSAFADSIKLYDWVFSNYIRMELLDDDTVLTEVPVRLSSDGSTVKLRARDPVTGVLPKGADLSQVQTSVTLYNEDVTAPLTEGQVLGEVTVSLDGITYGTAYLVTTRSMDLSYLASMLDSVSGTLANPIVLIVILVLLILAVLYLSSVIRYRRKFRKEQRELEAAKLRRQKLQEQAERERMMASAKRRSYQQAPRPKAPSTDVNRDYFEQFFDNSDTP